MTGMTYGYGLFPSGDDAYWWWRVNDDEVHGSSIDTAESIERKRMQIDLQPDFDSPLIW